MGHGGNHRQLLPRATDRHRHRGTTLGSVTAAPYIRIHQRRFVTPVNLSGFSFGAPLDGRILLVDPLLDGFWSLFVGALDGLLWREAPALEVVPNGTYCFRCNAETSFNAFRGAEVGLFSICPDFTLRMMTFANIVAAL